MIMWRALINKLRARFKANLWRRQKHIAQVLEMQHQLYKNTNVTNIAVAERTRLGITDTAFTYGEINLYSFLAILELIKPTAEDVFYDLGCGGGKTVFAIAYAYQIKTAHGIELLPALHDCCEQQLIKFDAFLQSRPEHNYKINFVHGDFLLQDISDATIIYLNATGLFADAWDQMQQQLLTVKPGCKIILNTKKLATDQFELLDETQRMMSWGPSTVRIYEPKIRSVCTNLT